MRILVGFIFFSLFSIANAQQLLIEPTWICPIGRDLGWKSDPYPPCYGHFQNTPLPPPPPENAIEINAANVVLRANGQSKLSGNVTVQEGTQQLSAATAYIYKNSNDKTIKKIELFQHVRYENPNHLMIAEEGAYFPENHSGFVKHVRYRIHTTRAHAILPAWGKADIVRLLPNKNYYLKNATYSTCQPTHPFWQIKASDIEIIEASKIGVAKHAWLEVGGSPLVYVPYLSFPTSNERKSGFLTPSMGYSNIGGYELTIPYYFNLAPNYDATFTPHLFTQRGVMLGGETRYLDTQTGLQFNGQFLPHDRAFKSFLEMNELTNPIFKHKSDNRWLVDFNEHTVLDSNWQTNVQIKHVSDDYFLQDFSNNLAITTENQLLGRGQIIYSSEKAMLRGMVEGYQTLHPINQPRVHNIYQRLPQLYGEYNEDELPANINLDLVSQFDYFDWPGQNPRAPLGPRYHLNPKFSRLFSTPWSYIKPSIEIVNQAYDVHGPTAMTKHYAYSIPRYVLDSGLYFDRYTTLFNKSFQQTLEPRLFYLNVPFHNQTAIPVYDSANMIFNTDQVFRVNRFSGFDRIGDANQLGYGFTSRFFSPEEDFERANFTIGQIHYFKKRQVHLCYDIDGYCLDSPMQLGFLSPTASESPIATHATYYFNRIISSNADYVWDPARRATNNGDLNFRYQPQNNEMISLGYTYLINGNLITRTPNILTNGPIHQATTAFALPLSSTWQTLGVYSYNLSEGYSMLGLFGLQYDSCCWAMRLLGGKTFMNVNTENLKPQYNTNFYFQFLFKGLGSLSIPDPSQVLHTYLPGVTHEF